MLNKYSLSLTLCALCLGAIAQNTLRQAVKGENGLFKEFVTLEGDISAPKPTDLVSVARTLGLDVNSSVKVLSNDADQIGLSHLRLQQTYQGLPIENSMFLLHERNGKLVSMNGQLVQDFPQNLATAQRQSLLAPDAALQTAIRHIGAKVYKWQVPGEEAFLKAENNDITASFFPVAEKVWISSIEGLEPAKLRLAYKFDIYAQEPLSRQYVFVDAKTGEIIGAKQTLHTTDVPGSSAVTAFSGTQTITTDSYNGSFRLREVGGRGLGIQTYNMQKKTTYNTAVDFTDADNVWNNVNTNKDQYATDAHWGAEKTYDYYKNTFNRNSIDNAGFAIKSYVHYSTNYFNAFWDGTRMTYGDGSATYGNKPLTAIDVCGHEITHGLTSFTANLTYSNESGALNEAFSDIFGNTIEWYARPSQNSWLIGEDFYTIRSMSNPNTYSQPDTYQGTYWATGTADNGGVHTNSGVLNYWYYLLSVGGSGTNDNGTAFSVTGITIAKAAAIAFRTLTVYLTPSSNYAACKTASLQAATDLYGAGSNEVTQVTNAWIAVGIGTTTGGGTACTDTYEANESLTAAKTIAVNTAISATIGTATDKDYFKFTNTTAAKNIKITLTGLPADYDVKLYNSAGTQLAVSQNSGTTAESIIYNNGAVGTYYVYVYGYGGVYSTSCYSLTASTSGTTFFGNDGSSEVVGGDIFILDHPNASKIIANGFYPNPASNVLNIAQTADIAGEQLFTLYDLSGRQVFVKTLALQESDNFITMDLPELQSGVYFVRLGEGKIQRLIIQK